MTPPKARRIDVVRAQLTVMHHDALGQHIDLHTRALARRSIRRPNGSLRAAFIAFLAALLNVEH